MQSRTQRSCVAQCDTGRSSSSLREWACSFPCPSAGRTYDFPYKAPVYASLVGLLNHNRDTFGEDFVRRLSTRLRDCIAAGEATHAKICLRILAELTNTNMVKIDDLMATLQALLGAAADAEDQNGNKSLP